MRLFHNAAVTLILCAISLPAAAQFGPTELGGMGRRGRYTTVSGTVREIDGSIPIESVGVKLQALSGGMSASTTSSGGMFIFNDVSSGTYYLVVEEHGYQRVQEMVNLVGRSSVAVQLTLRRIAPMPGEMAGTGPTVSTRELAIPRRAREAMQRGLSLANEKSDYPGSLAQFQRALREYPDYYEAYAQMGLVYLKMGDTAKSEEMLVKSIDMSRHKHGEALSALAFVYSSQKRFAEAEPLAREAVKLDSLAWDSKLELARALYGLDKSAEAEACALEALRMRPDNPQAHLVLANIHMKTRNYAALVKDLDSYLLLSPAGPDADQARRMREQIMQHLANTQQSTP